MGAQVTKRQTQVPPADDVALDETLLRQSSAGAEVATQVSAIVHTATSAAAPAGESADLVPGAVVKDRFEIETILGRGGMGVVYRAIDRRKVEAADRDPYVALKALSGTWRRDERMVIALQREARKAQTLAHPNIATVFDFDRDGDLVYITMEQLSGRPLDAVIQAHPQGLPHADVRSIVRGLCLGLAYAHNKGIVHSDFKPGNVFLENGNHPKVLDFGIARATPTAGDVVASSQTRFDAGELGALTPSYAALEMFEGAPPHPADDVYALAVTVYQLFTGRHPFNGMPAPQARAAGLTPGPIRGIARREWRAISRGLELHREDRIPHAAAFLGAFERSRSTRLAAVSAVLLALAFSGYFGFVQVEEQARIAPDTPFESLPEALQTRITEHLENGDMLRGFGDVHGALESYRDAYVAHPRNAEATDRLVSLFADAAAVLAANDHRSRETLKGHLEGVMAIDRFLGTHEELIAVRKTLETLP